jgi:hypothetical protein
VLLTQKQHQRNGKKRGREEEGEEEVLVKARDGKKARKEVLV